MTEQRPEPTYLDGNALAGPLTDLFIVDVAQASTCCVGCGHRCRVAELRVYLSGPGAVARCPVCSGVVLRYVRTSTTAILDLRGTLALSVQLETAAGEPGQS
jgi:hypothetical protein